MLHFPARNPANRRHGDGLTRSTTGTMSIWEHRAVQAAVQVGRLPLTLIPPTATMPILRGPLRGWRWVVGAGNHAYWLGVHEYAKQRVFERWLTPGCVFFDIGAHAGYYSLLAARLVRPGGQVVAFEPLPRNFAYLRKHLRLNGANTVTTIDAAVTESAGEATFQQGVEGSMGRVTAGGDLHVRTVALDGLVARGTIPPPDVIKLDAEGSEYRALSGARQTLAAHKPVLFLATHGAEVHARCLELLRELGYHVEAVGGGDVATTDELLAWHPERATLP